MFTIPYSWRDFPHPMLSGHGFLQADWDDVIWAALTVGRPTISIACPSIEVVMASQEAI